MRTPEQIGNLRTVFSIAYGPFFGQILSDEEIDALADHIKKSFSDRAGKIVWIVKVRIGGDKTPWEDIQSEPVRPVGTLYEIKKAIEKMLLDYQKLEAVQIEDANDPEKKHIFTRWSLSQEELK